MNGKEPKNKKSHIVTLVCSLMAMIGSIIAAMISTTTIGNVESSIINEIKNEIYYNDLQDTNYLNEKIISLQETVSYILDENQKLNEEINKLKSNKIDTASSSISVNENNDLMNSIPDQAIEYNGHYYMVYTESMYWTQAKEYCENLGGHLVTITSDSENQFIESIIENTSKRAYWIGLTDEEIEGIWRWVTDEKYEYKNWGRGQPNNHQGLEHYGGIVSMETRYDYTTYLGEWGDWANAPSDLREIGFICEWE